MIKTAAKAAIKAGEKSWREAAKLIATAQDQGATQTQIATAVGKSQAWVNRLLKWHRGGGKDSPFEADHAKRKLLAANKCSAVNDNDDDDELVDEDALLNRAVGKHVNGGPFSQLRPLGQRKEADFYETPYSITRHLFEKETFDYGLTVCEPACGNGAIVRVLKKKKFDSVTSYDIQTGTDFLKDTNQYDYIITNPPFSLAFEFMQHAKKLARQKFALLLPLSYLHGQQRFLHVYSDRSYGLKKVYVLTQYPMLGEPLREDGKYHTGMIVLAWYVFEEGYDQLPRFDWIDNHAEILKASDAELKEAA